ncbi:glycosyltransferase family 4 protein [Hanstruepera ponticola]|uniref:glycosyltransferase family 4 protein n=1 Tax=Hanstruepera ponticola TaxID=2042995 RepID=UPI00177CCF4B|nr:glycosyltransferase family 4 protein [Hanstruepera ponticola]
MNKKILIVTSEFPPQPGGIGNHAYNLGLYLSKNQFEVTVIADQRAAVNDQEKQFDAKLPFLVKRTQLKNIRLFMYFDRVFKTIKALKKNDLVIATGKFSLWNVAWCIRFLKRPSLAVIHGTEVNFKSFGLTAVTNWALKQFTQVIAVSNYTKDLVSHLNLKVTVIPNGINTVVWNKDHLECQELKGYPVLTTVGRVSSRKGQLEVIKHLPELIRDFPEIHYHCIGIPTEAEDFMNVARSLGVESFITFHGAVNDKFLKAALVATDIFVMLSTESITGDVEGFGIAILEANALGVPAIGSKGCGIEDAIKQNYSGFVIDRADSETFKVTISKILKAQEFFRLNSITWAQSHDWNIIIENYIGIISCVR